MRMPIATAALAAGLACSTTTGPSAGAGDPSAALEGRKELVPVERSGGELVYRRARPRYCNLDEECQPGESCRPDVDGILKVCLAGEADADQLDPETLQVRCTRDGDCRRGQVCRDRGDRVQLCMGHGKPNDYCSESADCGRGLACRRRSDGYRACMGRGDRGDYCESNTDCGQGLWCNDNAEGTRVCRE